jgi:hypothetical protein
MESKDAAAALAALERSRRDVAGAVVLPAGYEIAMAAAIAVQIALAAVALAQRGPAVPLLIGGGLLVFAAMAAIQLVRFRAANGLWLGAFASRAVLGTAPEASQAYVVALGGALVAGTQRLWWIVAALALAGAVGYVAGGRRWLGRYREDPLAHGPGPAVGWTLAVLALGAVGGVVLLASG